MRVGNPTKHRDSTRARVAAAIKSSPLDAISATLWISFADFERFLDSCFILYDDDDIDELFDSHEFAIYDVENELGYTIRGAARPGQEIRDFGKRNGGENIRAAATRKFNLRPANGTDIRSERAL